MSSRELLELLPAAYFPWLAALFLTGAGLTISIWSVRYDMLGFAVMAMIVHAIAHHNLARAKAFGWFALALAPIAGFHLVFVVAFLYVVQIWSQALTQRAAIIDMLFMTAGGLSMRVYYGWTVGLRRFLFLTFFSDHTMFGQAARGVVKGFGGFILSKLAALLQVFTQDLSYTLVLAGALVLWRWRWAVVDRLPQNRRADIALFAGSVVLPLLLSAIGKYPPYYSWIGWVSLCLLFVRLIAEARPVPGSSTMRWLAAVSAGSLVLGFGHYMYSELRSLPAANLNNELSAAIALHTRPGEIFYAADGAYFLAWQHAKHVYVRTYAQNHFLPGFPTPEPVTAMIVKTSEFEKVRTLLGGNWRCPWQASSVLRDGGERLELCNRAP